jgi:hypothetical protein
VLLPHMSSATIEGRIDMGDKVIINIRTFIDGHRPPDRVLPGRVLRIRAKRYLRISMWRAFAHLDEVKSRDAQFSAVFTKPHREKTRGFRQAQCAFPAEAGQGEGPRRLSARRQQQLSRCPCPVHPERRQACRYRGNRLSGRRKTQPTSASPSTARYGLFQPCLFRQRLQPSGAGPRMADRSDPSCKRMRTG